MFIEKRKRGRPRGTGKNEDILVMMGIARLRKSDPDHSIAGAAKRFATEPSDADIRRIRRKWRERGQEMTANVDLISDTLALSGLPYSQRQFDALFEVLEALPERSKYKHLNATAIIELACSIRFGSILEELQVIGGNPVLGAVRRIGRGRKKFLQ